MAIGKCLRCDRIAKMTEDHVVPLWFQKILPAFNIKDLPNQDTELVCEPCNSTKGGRIDFSFSAVRSVMRPIITHFVTEFRKYEEFPL